MMPKGMLVRLKKIIVYEVNPKNSLMAPLYCCFSWQTVDPIHPIGNMSRFVFGDLFETAMVAYAEQAPAG